MLHKTKASKRARQRDCDLAVVQFLFGVRAPISYRAIAESIGFNYPAAKSSIKRLLRRGVIERRQPVVNQPNLFVVREEDRAGEHNSGRA
jgi:hypothetical protein